MVMRRVPCKAAARWGAWGRRPRAHLADDALRRVTAARRAADDARRGQAAPVDVDERVEGAQQRREAPRRRPRVALQRRGRAPARPRARGGRAKQRRRLRRPRRGGSVHPARGRAGTRRGRAHCNAATQNIGKASALQNYLCLVGARSASRQPNEHRVRVQGHGKPWGMHQAPARRARRLAMVARSAPTPRGARSDALTSGGAPSVLTSWTAL